MATKLPVVQNMIAIDRDVENTPGSTTQSTAASFISIPIEQDQLIDNNPSIVASDEGEANLSHGERYVDELTRKFSGPINCKLTPSLMGLVMGCFADSVSESLLSGESSTYQSDFIVNSRTIPSVRTRNMHVYHWGTMKSWLGAFLSGIEFTVTRGEGRVPASFTLNGFMGEDGSPLLSASDMNDMLVYGNAQGDNQEQAFSWKEVSVDLGSYNHSTNAFSSSDDIKDVVHSVTPRIGVELDVDEETALGQTSKFVQGFYAFRAVASCQLNLISSAYADEIKDALDNETQQAIRIKLEGSQVKASSQGTSLYLIEVILPETRIIEPTLQVINKKAGRSAPLRILSSEDTFAHVNVVGNPDTFADNIS